MNFSVDLRESVCSPFRVVDAWCWCKMVIVLESSPIRNRGSPQVGRRQLPDYLHGSKCARATWDLTGCGQNVAVNSWKCLSSLSSPSCNSPVPISDLSIQLIQSVKTVSPSSNSARKVNRIRNYASCMHLLHLLHSRCIRTKANHRVQSVIQDMVSRHGSTYSYTHPSKLKQLPTLPT